MKLKLIGLGIIFLLISCKTYTITKVSKDQFTKTDNNKMKDLETNNPLFLQKFKYLSNDIKYLNTTDKRKSSFLSKNSPSLEMR
jgi:predicted phage-related endonuclease